MGDFSPRTTSEEELPTTSGPATSNEPAPTIGERSPTPPTSSNVTGTPAPGTTTSEMFDSVLNYSTDLFRGSREVLRETYIPARLPHREQQLHRVAEVIAPALKGVVPSNLFIYGKIGTGKTAVVAQVRAEMQRRSEGSGRLAFITLNCANIDTPYSLLQTVGNTFARHDIERIPTGWSLDRVQAGMRQLMDRQGCILILVLDEIDRLVAKSGDSVLYTLSQINTELEKARLVILGISNDLKFTNNLDARVRSRLNEEKDPFFRPTTRRSRVDILRDRAQEVFREGVVDAGVIERCAAYAALENGDATWALALLRLAAEVAERDHAKRITSDHVVRAKSRYEQNLIDSCCKTLPTHCKVLLYAILQGYDDDGAVFSPARSTMGTRGSPNDWVFSPCTREASRTTFRNSKPWASSEPPSSLAVGEGEPGRSWSTYRSPRRSRPSRTTRFSRCWPGPAVPGQTILTNFDNPNRTGPANSSTAGIFIRENSAENHR